MAETKTKQKRSKKNANVKPQLQFDNVSAEAETIKRFNQERLRRVDHLQIGFYLVLVFQSTSQKREFLSQVNVATMYDGLYCDGEEFAEKVGIQITPNEIPATKNKLNNRRSAMVDLNKINNPEPLKTVKNRNGQMKTAIHSNKE